LRLKPIQARSRSGVSPVVAELCLIAVLLISAVILAGLVYGSFSYYNAPAEVAAQTLGCSASNGSEVCHLVLDNLGAREVNTDGACSMSVGGSELAGTIENGGTVPADGSLQGVACVVAGATANPGDQIGGVIALDNGAIVYFTALSS